MAGVGDSVDMEEESAPPQRAPEHVSELGALVLAQPLAGPAVLHTVRWQNLSFLSTLFIDL